MLSLQWLYQLFSSVIAFAWNSELSKNGAGGPLCIKLIFFLKKFFNVYSWEREGDTESEAGSRLSAVSTEPYVGLERTTGSWPEPKSDA